MQINIQKLDYKEKYNSIRNHQAFYKLSPEIIQSIIKKLLIENFCKNQIVYNESEQLQKMYIVKIGEFKMSKRILQQNTVFSYLKKWKQHEICILEKHDTFGIELMDVEPIDYYKYTVSCQTVIGQLYSLKIVDLQKILIEHHIKIEAKNLFIYQQQLSKNRLYVQREAQINQIFSNLTQSLQHKEVRSFSQHHNSIDNPKYIINHRSISYDESYCDKVQSLINYQKQVILNPRRIIKTEILEDDNYVNKSVNNHIKALKPFITNFENGRQSNDRHQIQSLDRIDELNQNEKLFKLKVLYKLGYRPKKKLQIKLHSIQSQRLSQIFPFKIK